MKKIKYIYNPETLNYEVAESNWRKKSWYFVGWLCSSVVFGLILFLFYSKLFISPGERILQQELKRMKTEYDIAMKDIQLMDEVLVDLKRRDENLYRVTYEAEPITDVIREGAFGGKDYYSRFNGFSNAEIMKELDSSIRKLKHKLYIQSLSFDEMEEIAQNKNERFAHVPAIHPVSIHDNKVYLSSGYGYRLHPVYKRRKLHPGCDFSAPIGTPIYATGDGVIQKVRSSRTGYGKEVVIDHGFGFETRYAHMNSIEVRRGQTVKRGDQIGTVGNSGLSTGPHLHYEVIRNNRKINPFNFFHNDLTPEEYAEMLRISETLTKSLD